MLRPLVPQNRSRPRYLRTFHCSIARTLEKFLCTCPKSLTPGCTLISVTQFSAICYKTDIRKIALRQLRFCGWAARQPRPCCSGKRF